MRTKGLSAIIVTALSACVLSSTLPPPKPLWGQVSSRRIADWELSADGTKALAAVGKFLQLTSTATLRADWVKPIASGDLEEFTAVAISPDNRWAAAYDNSVGELVIWNAVNGTELLRNRQSLASQDELTFSANSRRLFARSGDEVIDFVISGSAWVRGTATWPVPDARQVRIPHQGRWFLSLVEQSTTVRIHDLTNPGSSFVRELQFPDGNEVSLGLGNFDATGTRGIYTRTGDAGWFAFVINLGSSTPSGITASPVRLPNITGDWVSLAPSGAQITRGGDAILCMASRDSRTFTWEIIRVGINGQYQRRQPFNIDTDTVSATPPSMSIARNVDLAAIPELPIAISERRVHELRILNTISLAKGSLTFGSGNGSTRGSSLADFSANGAYFVTAAGGGQAIVWATANQRPVARHLVAAASGSTGFVGTRFLSNGWLALLDNNRSVSLVNPVSGALIRRLSSIAGSNQSALAVTPQSFGSSGILIAVGNGNRIALFSSISGLGFRPPITLPRPASVEFIQFSRDGTKMLVEAGSWVYAYQTSNWALLASYYHNRTGVSWTAAGNRIYIGPYNSFYRIQGNTLVAAGAAPGPGDAASEFALGPDDRTIFRVGTAFFQYSRLYVLNGNSSTAPYAQWDIASFYSPDMSLAISPTNAFLLAISANGYATLYPNPFRYVPPISVVANPASLRTVGTLSTVTVRLQGVAPAGGTVATLSSVNAAIIGVSGPTSVTIPAGQAVATFKVRLNQRVTRSTVVGLIARTAGGQATGRITAAP
jgi:hypothetical protein